MSHEDPRAPLTTDQAMDQAVALVNSDTPGPVSAPLPPEAAALPVPATALPLPHGEGEPAASDEHDAPEPQPRPTPDLAPAPAPQRASAASVGQPGCSCAGAPVGYPEHIGRRPPAYPPFPKSKPAVAGDAFAAYTPDTVVDGITLPGLAVLGASMRGDSHRWEGTCRQDAMVLARIGSGDEELLVLAVADGVGSSKLSHVASHSVSEAVISTLDEEAHQLHRALVARDQHTVNALVNSAVGATVTTLVGRWTDPRTGVFEEHEYATTLHLLLVPTDTRIRDRAWVSIGDGGLLRLVGGEWQGLEGQDDGVASTRTAALPSTRHATVRLLQTAPGDLLLLGTDGITNPINQELEFRERLAAYWGSDEVPSLSEFLGQAQLRAKTYDDDRTVVCLWEGATDR